ncbi:hypothetical protein L6164_025790 [Bauhinia variegata]|uniref:Uncharacterized protein n=1 Tax=Bauhinia variegata TaxID=167791 RepID=A0ACB9M2N1_BAUVA|nr:hypothetical protein L6164_025790 [Bauhinia variegata]
MSSCKGKLSWPELVGVDAVPAVRLIEGSNPNVKAIVLPEDSIVTTDFLCDRVRVFVDKDNVVAKTPKIG